MHKSLCLKSSVVWCEVGMGGRDDHMQTDQLKGDSVTWTRQGCLELVRHVEED